MPRRLTVFPPPQAPPHLYQQIPAIRRIREAYAKRFDLRVFAWPFFDPHGARDPEAVVAALHEPLAGASLVVAEAPAVTPLLIAMDRGAPRPDAFVAVGLDPTAATMRSLGLGEVVEAAKRLTDTEGRLRQVRGFLAGVIDDADILGEGKTDVSWQAVFRFEDWLENVDQLTLGPFEDVLALVFTSAMFPLLAEGEVEQVFQRVFPNSRTAQLEKYPSDLDKAATGDELTSMVIPFLESVSAGVSGDEALSGDADVEEIGVIEAPGKRTASGSLARPSRGWEAGPYMWGGVWRLRRR